eukprot:gene47457-21734_t
MVDLGAPSWDEEERVRMRVAQAGVLLTPGRSLRAPFPGMFQLCYAAASGVGCGGDTENEVVNLF